MEIKIGYVRGYDTFWVQTKNPMEKPSLKDFDGNDVDYLTEMSIWERMESNQKKYSIVESQRKIAKIFLDKQVAFELVKEGDFVRAKLVGKKNE